jgi:hypothetical protein
MMNKDFDLNKIISKKQYLNILIHIYRERERHLGSRKGRISSGYSSNLLTSTGLLIHGNTGTFLFCFAIVDSSILSLFLSVPVSTI